MAAPEVVLDTNVLVAGLRSQLGAAFDVLRLVGTGQFGINVSIPLLMEYEDVLLRPNIVSTVPPEVIKDVLDYHCTVARQHEIFFLWRPVLKDSKDDMVLELAVKARCGFIVTYNERDFAGCERFGVEAITPGEFLKRIGVYR
ncbi:MAG TPA: putative toxin-antitoxin system toxin component, PIN family [Longimicrobium sp.]